MPTDIESPAIDYAAVLPILLVLGAAVVGVLVEAFVPAARRRVVQLVVALLGLVGALAAVVAQAGEPGVLTVAGALAIDGPTLFLQGTLCVLGVAAVLLLSENSLDSSGGDIVSQAAVRPGSKDDLRLAESQGIQTEVYPLLLFAVFGMLLFPASNDLLTMFVALEILSLPLYLLTGLARRRRLLSQEAALKYFLLGAFSSGFFLYGAALIYGFSGSMQFSQISEAVRNDVDNRVMLLVGLGLLAVGLLFKVGAVPFQAWTPDVYQGAPTPVTAFMSAGTKVAAFGAILRLFYVAFGADRWSWQPMLWIIAILTMVLGAVLAVTQTDIKRLLAYSSVAHTGFILTGVLGVQASGDLSNGEISSLQAVLFYLATYGLMTLGAFAVVGLVRDSAGEATTLSRWAGLGKEAPVVAGVFAFFLLAMAGIPLTSGFVGKWAVFSVALAAGAWPVVVAAIASSIIAVYLYVRVIVLMYFADPIGEGPSVVRPSVLTATAIAVGAAATLMLGVLPGPLLDLAARAGEFIR